MSRTRRSGLLRQVMGPRRGRARVCAAYRRGPRPAAREARTRAEDRRESAPLVGVAFDVVERDSGIGGGRRSRRCARLPSVLLPAPARARRCRRARGRHRSDGQVGREPRRSHRAGLIGHGVGRERHRRRGKLVRAAGWRTAPCLGLERPLACPRAGIHRLAWGVGARGSRPSLRVTIAFTGAVLVWVALIAFAIGALDRSGVEGVAGVLGIAAALLFSLYLAGRLIAATAVLDATLWERRRARR